MAEKRSAAKQAHLYALMAWNDQYDEKSATELIDKTDLSALDGITYAETSIKQAIEGIVKKDIKGKISGDPAVLHDAIIEIIDGIHNKWVAENPHKFDRGNEVKSNKNLFQHLPTALIGIDEVAKDLMFLAPFVEEMGVSLGNMQMTAYGSFVPSKEVTEAYKRFVAKYKAEHGITNAEELESHIKGCVDGGYEPLQKTTKKQESTQPRIDYMKKHTSILTETVQKKNAEQFPEQSQPQ